MKKCTQTIRGAIHVDKHKPHIHYAGGTRRPVHTPGGNPDPGLASTPLSRAGIWNQPTRTLQKCDNFHLLFNSKRSPVAKSSHFIRGLWLLSRVQPKAVPLAFLPEMLLTFSPLQGPCTTLTAERRASSHTCCSQDPHGEDMPPHTYLCWVMDPPSLFAFLHCYPGSERERGRRLGEKAREFQGHASLTLKSLSILRGNKAAR